MTTEQEKQVKEHMAAIADIFKGEHQSNPQSSDNCIIIASTNGDLKFIFSGSELGVGGSLAQARAKSKTIERAVQNSEFFLAKSM